MIGDALVAVALVRNILAATLWFAIVPWINAVGIRNVFIVCAVTSVPVLLLPVPLLLWGRRGRTATASKYKQFSLAAIPPATLNKILE